VVLEVVVHRPILAHQFRLEAQAIHLRHQPHKHPHKAIMAVIQLVEHHILQQVVVEVQQQQDHQALQLEVREVLVLLLLYLAHQYIMLVVVEVAKIREIQEQ
jgi:hypothetical protein